ncbi:hypothetical protein Ga0123461_0751 [Mariprofundus aestuarium]|uniref:Ferredoxin n=1 Tax=Mariprofundus aestuarium TaxID=1921086 RepID=A0A2K8KWC8_MARES|nr:hypothetical protein Ga0123461_0751 [Mariprofundus aestuarium]
MKRPIDFHALAMEGDEIMTRDRKHNMGSGGYCVCPKCGEKTPHHKGVPCQKELCHSCGTKLLREDSDHYQLFKQKQDENRRK